VLSLSDAPPRRGRASAPYRWRPGTRRGTGTAAARRPRDRPLPDWWPARYAQRAPPRHARRLELGRDARHAARDT
jgi:hypothetical protein